MSNAADQTFQTIPPEALLEKAGNLRKQGYRLVQIGATRLPEHVELTYSFDLESRLTNLRFQVPAEGARLPSISSLFWCAFIYENELHDLFNVRVDGMAVDFHGHFYETTVKFPFGSIKAPAAKPPAELVGQASRLPKGRPALSPANAGETPGATGETPAPLPLRGPSDASQSAPAAKN